MPYFDRFDICEAYYLWLSHNHGGQWSPEYVRLCRLLTYFTPRPNLSIHTLGDNGKAYYKNLNDTRITPKGDLRRVE